jgi:hypothetical protein
MRNLTSGAVATQTIYRWLDGSRRPPVWALERIADAIRDRCRDGLAIELELLAEIARRKLDPSPCGGGAIGRAMLVPGRGEPGRSLVEPGE